MEVGILSQFFHLAFILLETFIETFLVSSIVERTILFFQDPLFGRDPRPFYSEISSSSGLDFI